jgi:hypothetical protein
VIEVAVRFAGILVAVYAGLGLCVAVALHAGGLRRIDPATRGAGLFFRLLITPGIVALWPLLATRWRRAAAGAPLRHGVHRPVSAAGLRRLHRGTVLALVVVVPLSAAAALILRPGEPRVVTDTRRLVLQPDPLPRVIATHEQPFGELPLRLVVRAGAASRQIELVIDEDLEIPNLLLYWTEDEAEFARSAVFLGAVWGPGVRRFDLDPRSATAEGSLVLYSLAWQERIGSFRLYGE